MTRLITLATLAVLFAASASAQVSVCTTSWTNAAGGDWNTAANWDNGVPGPTDDACVTLNGTYTVTNTTAPQIDVNSLTLGAASGTQTLISDEGIALGAPSTIEPNGVLEWLIGDLTGGTTLTNDGLIIIRTFFNFEQRTIEGVGTQLVNEGTIDFQDDQLHLVDGGALINNASLIKTVQGVANAEIEPFGANPGTFTNTGTIDVQAGRLFIDANSVTNGAMLTVAAGATLAFGGGDDVVHTFAGTTTGSSASETVDDAAGILRMSGDAQFAAASGAVWDFGGGGILWDQADLIGGETLTNDGLIVITGFFNFEQRTIEGVGTQLVNEGTIDFQDDQLHLVDGGALINNASLIKTVQGVANAEIEPSGANPGLFTNTGTIDVQAGRLHIDADSRTDGAVLTVASDARLRFGGGGAVTHTFAGTSTGAPAGTLGMEDDAQFAAEPGAVWNVGGTGLRWDQADLIGGETLTNQGLIVIDGFFSFNQRSINGLGTELLNAGTIDWRDDQLFLGDDGALTNTGLITKTVGSVSIAELVVDGVNTGSRRFTNTGTIDVQVGRIDIEADSYTDGATLTAASGAQLNFGGGEAVTHTFAGTTSGTPEGTLRMTGDAQFAAVPGGTWDFGGTGIEWVEADLIGGQTLTNQGLIVITNFFSGIQRSIVGLGTVLANEGTVDWRDDQVHLIDDGAWTNSGLLLGNYIGVSQPNLSFSGTDTGSRRFTNTGTVEVRVGTLNIDVPFDHEGGAVISGYGTFDIAGSTFKHDGDTAPGSADSTGVLTWSGRPWAPPASATLSVEIAGPTLDDNYDQLDVNGAATLDGTLEINVTSTAGLTVGDTFTILDASGGVTGTFSSLSVTGIPGPTFSVAYNPNTVVLTLETLASPLTLNGRAGWRTLSTPFPDLPIGGRTYGFLETIYTAGYLGADLDQRNNRGLANVFLYDESTGEFTPPDDAGPIPGGEGLWVYVFIDDDPRTPGPQGFFPKTLQSSGTPASFPFDIPVTYTPSVVRDGDTPALGINLVGNPANEDIDWDDPNWTKTNVSDVLYIYDPAFNGGDWRTWNGTTGTLPREGRISVGQGFHVETTGPDPELVVPTSALLSTQSPLYRFTDGGGDTPTSASKGETEATPLLSFRLEAGLAEGRRQSEAFVSFEPEGALGFDRRDARLLAGAPGADALRLYTRLGEVHGEHAGAALQIAAMPEPDGGVVQLELGAEALRAGAAADADVSLSWEATALPSSWTAVLVDRHSGSRYDLTEAGTVPLALSAADALTVTEADAGEGRDGVQAAIDAAVALGEAPPTPVSPQARALRVVAPTASLKESASTRFVIEIDPLGALASTAGPSLGAVFPNPAGRVARVELRLPVETDVRVAVYDVLGRRVADVHDGVLTAGLHALEVPVASLAPGAYVVRVDGPGLGESRRLTVAR